MTGTYQISFSVIKKSRFTGGEYYIDAHSHIRSNLRKSNTDIQKCNEHAINVRLYVNIYNWHPMSSCMHNIHFIVYLHELLSFPKVSQKSDRIEK